MIWNTSLHALIPRNPLVTRDLSYQQRTATRLSKFIDSVGIVAVAIGFAAAMFFHMTNNKGDPRNQSIYVGGVQILAWMSHTAVVLRLLTAGALSSVLGNSAVSADELFITPLTNQQLLIGRWWAVMHQVRGWILALGIIQAGIILAVALGTMLTVNWSMMCLNPCQYTIHGLVVTNWASLGRLISISGAIIIIPILEAMCCTALGMACAIVFGSRLGLIAALALRLLPVFIFAFVPNYSSSSQSFMNRFAEYNWFSFADGGTGAALQLARSFHEYNLEFLRGNLALFAILVMFLLYVAGSLGAAWALLRRSRR